MADQIERILVLGDSLSDRGTMAKSAIGAFSGLPGNSPHGRFTNDYVWIDYLIQKLYVNELPPQVSTESHTLKSMFAINNDVNVGTETAPAFARTYCEGGMTAHDYSTRILPGQLFLNAEAHILATLDEMRKKAELNDKQMKLDANDKARTLVIEWSGANDLITVNDTPTIDAAKLAVDARIRNLKEMISSGYSRFVLVNLPDLSLTPRYQVKNPDQKDEAHHSVTYFNYTLEQEVSALKTQYPDCNIDIFDANAQFSDAYNHPAQYGLSEEKKHTPFLNSDAFKKQGAKAPKNAADEYTFWDEVHPTKTLHVALANCFYDAFFATKYEFNFSKEPLIEQFREAYGMKLDADKASTCGNMRKSRIDYLKDSLTLKDILHHGLFNKGYRTQGVMQKLGWIHENKHCATDHPCLAEAMAELKGDTSIDADAVRSIEIEMKM